MEKQFSNYENLVTSADFCIDCGKLKKRPKSTRCFKCVRKKINAKNWQRNRARLMEKKRQKRAAQPGYLERAEKRLANKIAKESRCCAFCGKSGSSGKYCNRNCQHAATIYKKLGLRMPSTIRTENTKNRS
jgi:hypothetical protein